MVDINLLIQKGKEIKAEKIKAIATLILAVTIGFVLFLGLIFYGHKLWRQKQINDLTIKIQSLKESEAAFGDLEQNAKTLQNQTSSLRNLFSNHVYFSSFLKALASVTSKKVQYINLTTDTTGIVTLNGGAKSFGDISLLITRLKEAPILDENGQAKLDSSGQSLRLFTGVEFKSSSLETETTNKKVYKFSFNLKFNDQILRK